jgi:folate-binding protein YgfZ
MTDPHPEPAYEALRDGVGAYLLPRDVMVVRGPDALSYLQGQCSQDLEPLADGAAVDALVLSPQGKVDALVRVTRRSEGDFVVDVDGGFGDAVRQRLERFRLRVKVEIQPLAWHCLALRGPGALGVAAHVAGDDALVLPVAWGGLDGVDLLGPPLDPPPEVPVCSDAVWEAARIEAGLPRMGAELDGRTIPAEADLVERCVSFSKGCYTGQELVARLDARGSNVARRMAGLVFGGVAPDGAATLPGSPLQADGKATGPVTSAAWSPGLGTVVGLGYVHRRVGPGAVLAVGPATGDAVDDGGDGNRAGVVAEVRALPLR